MSDWKEVKRSDLTDPPTKAFDGTGLEAGFVLLRILNTRRACIACIDAAGEQRRGMSRATLHGDLPSRWHWEHAGDSLEHFSFRLRQPWQDGLSWCTGVSSGVFILVVAETQTQVSVAPQAEYAIFWAG